jgi:hemerythrin-like domain-containing protein
MATRNETDACALLDADHRAVKKLFNQFDELAGSSALRSVKQRMEIAREICMQLTVHAQIEEEIFYPQLRGAFKKTDLLAEAEIEHGTAKDLIAQIQSAQEPNEEFDAQVKVLGEYIDHHVKEERNEIFPKARSTRGLDLVAMRDELAARKQELLAEHNEVAASSA